jgi:hypothetical protein
LIAVVLTALFGLNARWGPEANVDAIAAGAPAWRLVEAGTLDLSEFEGRNPWLVEDVHGRLVSNRAPGLVAFAIPGYFVWRVQVFTNGPASLIALLATVGAILIVWKLARDAYGNGVAIVGALVLALGTTTWAVASAQLWPHGVGQLLAMLTVLAVAAGSYTKAGFASAVAITVRPMTAIYAGIVGLWEGWRRRDAWVTFRYGAICLAGAALVLLYNRWLFGTWSLVGGTTATGLTGSFGSQEALPGYWLNLWDMFFGLNNGLFVWSPIVLISAYGAFRFINQIPGWATGTALAAIAYLLVHVAFNRSSGGMELFYRYPLEALALSSIALIGGAKAVYGSGRLGRWAVWFTAGFSVAVQFLNVFYLSCLIATPNVPACVLS